MAMVEEEIGSVLLRADRIVLGDLVQNHRPELHLVAARGAFVPADRPAHLEGRLLGRLLAGLEDSGRDLGLEGHGLQITRAVAHDQEYQLALLAFVVQPALDPDVTALVGADRPDSRRLHSLSGEKPEL